MKGSKFGFFAPLNGDFLDTLEEDEILSATSAVLCMYARSTHPGLLQLLLSWHAEGYAVGARLLCYSCRLAEDIVSSNTLAILDLKNEDAIQSPQKHAKRLDTPSGKSRKLSMLSACSWHQEGGLLAQARPAVAASFMAYKEFLKGLENKDSSILEESCSNQPVSVSGNHKMTVTERHMVYKLQPWLVKDLETCLAWSIPRLLSILPFVFNYLPDLSRGNEQVLKMLVSTVDPVGLSKLELKLSLKEISVFGTSLVHICNLVKSSLLWDCFEQQYFWRLLVSDWQNPTSRSVSDFLESCALFLRPEQHCEASSGLLSLLKMHCPTMHLVSTMLLLPRHFNKLVAAVLATWTLRDTSRFLECLTGFVTKRTKDSDNNHSNEQTQVELRQIKDTLLKLTEELKSKATTNSPVTSPVQ
ncbi:hypothetical protein L7F22_040762 [Adiantum nelumboides]|nr:hypothetical protein [Adiantum nelumboides]